jgi:hypothetical protein
MEEQDPKEILRDLNDTEINSVKEFKEVENNEEAENENHGRVYWIFRNIRKGIANWFGNHKVKGIILILILLAAVFFLRAYIHPATLTIRKYFVLILLLWLIVWFFRRRIRKKDKFFSKLIGNLSLIGLLVAGYFFGPPVYKYLGLYYHYQTLEKKEISSLPLTEQERIQPLNSIKTLVNQEVLAETKEATLPHIVIRHDGRLDFSMCVGPSTRYLYQQFTENMTEIISVPANAAATGFGKDTKHPVKFDVGENLILSSYSFTTAIKRLNFIEFFNYEADEVKFIERAENDWIQVITLIKWEGWIVPRPVFGGVIIIDQIEKNTFGNFIKRASIGKGEFIKPNEIKSYSYLKKQNLLSDRIATFSAESFRFQNGFMSPMPGYHQGDIRVPQLPEDQNQQPFVAYFNFTDVIKGKQGELCHYFGLEPFQENKRALNTSIFIPSSGVDNTVYYIDHVKNGDGFTGSSSIASKVKESKKNYDWTANNPAETRPYIKMINGKRQFFWLSTVITKVDKEGKEFIGGTVPELTLTDALTSEVFWVERDNLKDESLWLKKVPAPVIHNITAVVDSLK